MSDTQPHELLARRGFSVSYKGKKLLSLIDPIAQGEKAIESISKLERTLYLCPSPLYGYGLESFLKILPQDSVIVCIEADQELFNLSKRTMKKMLENNPEHLHIINYNDAISVYTYIEKNWGRRRFRRVEVIRLSLGWQLFPDLYEEIIETLRQEFILDWSNAATLVKFGRRYILNAIRNLAIIPKTNPISDLHFGNIPVLVLGAGPSLDITLEKLFSFFPYKEKERPFKIVCVDTAVKALYERNIKPDLVVALESQYWNLQDFIGLGTWEIPIAMDFSAIPKTFEFLGKKHFLFASPWTYLTFFHRLKNADLLPDTITPLGSVGLSAVKIAQKISSGIIITAGLDFSHTLDSFHTRSSPSHLEKLRRSNRLKSIIDADNAFSYGSFAILSKIEKKVRSSHNLKNYRDIFEKEFAGEKRIYDIESSGLHLGIRTLSLEEAIKILGKGNNIQEKIEIITDERKRENVKIFIQEEKSMLIMLCEILSSGLHKEKLESLLDKCDYLWAHFPECAGTEGRRPSSENISFLKRVRIEIDPILKRFDLALKELE